MAAQRALNEQLSRSRTAQAHAEGARHEFVTCVSHEIRTPLNAVTGAAALLQHTTLSDEQRDLLEILEAGASHVCVIVDDILNLNEIETGRFKARAAGRGRGWRGRR